MKSLDKNVPANSRQSSMLYRFSRISKLIISFGFLCVCVLADILKRTFRQPRKSTCSILYYHGITADQRRGFARQMDLLLRWSTPIATTETSRSRLGERRSAVTFDDGLESFVRNALPELRRRMIPVTMFVVLQSLGKAPTWISTSGEAIASDRVMSCEQLRELPSNLVTIGSHSLTHPHLSKLPSHEARREICDSKIQLGNMLGKDIEVFSFPYGDFDDDLVQLCRDAGYKRVFTTLPYLATATSDEFVSGRIAVEPTDWRLEFYLKVLGAYRWLPGAFAWKRALKSLLRRPLDSRRPRGYEQQNCL